MLDNASNQPKFRTKHCVEINDESRGGYNVSSQIKFKSTMLKSSLCDYSDAYILFKGTIAFADTSTAGAAANDTNQKVIFKNCAPFTNCISQMNNTTVDNSKDIDIIMSICNLIEYSDNHSKTSGSFWQYCKDTSTVNNKGNIVNFNGANATDSYNSRAKINGQIDEDGEIDNVEIMVPLKHLSNF